jgi:hypothetical protein
MVAGSYTLGRHRFLKLRTDAQEEALWELENSDFATATAYRLKELLRWIRHAASPQAAKWRITHFIRHAEEQIGDNPLLEPVRTSLNTLKEHRNDNRKLTHFDSRKLTHPSLCS